MKILFYKLFFFLTLEEKRNFFKLSFFSILNSFLEILSLSAIIPILIIILKQDGVVLLAKYFSYFNYELTLNKKEIFLFSILFFLITNFVKFFLYLSYKSKFYEYISELNIRVKNEVFKYFLSLSYSELINFKHSKILSNINRSNLLANTLIKSLLEIFNDVILIILLTIIVIFFVNLSNFLILIFLLITVFFVGKLFKKKIERIGTKINLLNENFADYTLNCLRNIKIIILENKFNFFFTKVSNINISSIKNINKFHFFQSITRPFIELILVIIISIILFFSFTKMSIENLVIYLTMFVAIFSKLGPYIIRVLSCIQSINYTKREILTLLDDFDKFRKVNNVNTVLLKSNNFLNFNNFIEIKNLSFKYDGSEKYIFKNFNYKFFKNDILKISGKTGSGKSTLIELLIGLYDNYSGDVICDNIKIKNYIKAWRSKINYIPQELHIFNEKIINNIFLGESDNKIDQKKFKELTKICLLDEIFEKYENKEFTQIGGNNVKLSGGENQRINLARGLVKNGEILILDEATNALNIDHEKKIIENIIGMNKFKLIIIISHNNNLDYLCNKLLNLDDVLQD